jgi:hypothetical protein
MCGLKDRNVAPGEGGAEVGPLLGEGGGALGPQGAVVRLTVAQVRPNTWTVKKKICKGQFSNRGKSRLI